MHKVWTVRTERKGSKLALRFWVYVTKREVATLIVREKSGGEGWLGVVEVEKRIWWKYNLDFKMLTCSSWNVLVGHPNGVYWKSRAKKRFIFPFLRLPKLTYLLYFIRLPMMMSIKAPNDSVYYPFQVKLSKLIRLYCLRVTLMVGISEKIAEFIFLGKAFLYSLNDGWWKGSNLKV